MPTIIADRIYPSCYECEYCDGISRCNLMPKDNNIIPYPLYGCKYASALIIPTDEEELLG